MKLGSPTSTSSCIDEGSSSGIENAMDSTFRLIAPPPVRVDDEGPAMG